MSMSYRFKMTAERVVFLAVIASFLVSAETLFALYPGKERARTSSRIPVTTILSGWEAFAGQIPYQLSMRMVNRKGYSFACGASLIHPEWAITAAHCTAVANLFVIRAGAVNLTQPEAITESTEFYNHPKYNNSISYMVQPHDIALLKLKRNLTFSERIKPIRLQPSKDKDKNYNGVRMVASGWGRTSNKGNISESLQWVYLKGISNADCWKTFGGSPTIINSTICAGPYNATNQSPCQGDSGGPLTVVDEDGELTMVGIGSFVPEIGCDTGLPAGYVRPGHYHDWIREVTGIDFDWGYNEESSEESISKDSPSAESEKTTTIEAGEGETTISERTTKVGGGTTPDLEPQSITKAEPKEATVIESAATTISTPKIVVINEIVETEVASGTEA